ncbi:hypothetical protein GCK72_005870 [Caenorhabditis remanei]|uniref:Uncharacterized protein n=1 Tax=Caenorhabditis remanei TaxID=31234 RepID=A0A6A5HGG9_CAERE|nr:hypothetical protein GCK72_005870 [Caenorhabditis remanei]KAF1765917.1 hypothetical protein GCK72_005870 [Caenorhabditis remanei]
MTSLSSFGAPAVRVMVMSLDPDGSMNPNTGVIRYSLLFDDLICKHQNEKYGQLDHESSTLKMSLSAPPLTSLWVEAPPAAGTVHAGGSAVKDMLWLRSELLVKTDFSLVSPNIYIQSDQDTLISRGHFLSFKDQSVTPKLNLSLRVPFFFPDFFSAYLICDRITVAIRV